MKNHQSPRANTSNSQSMTPQPQNEREQPELVDQDSTAGGVGKETPAEPCTDVVVFPLGRLVVTPGAIDFLDRHNLLPQQLLARHVSGEQATLSRADHDENRSAIKHGWRVMSAFEYGANKESIWVVSEADRSCTTILLPSEY